MHDVLAILDNLKNWIKKLFPQPPPFGAKRMMNHKFCLQQCVMQHMYIENVHIFAQEMRR